METVADMCAEKVVELLLAKQVLNQNSRLTDAIVDFVTSKGKATKAEIEKAVDCYGKTCESLCYRAQSKGWLSYDKTTKLWTVGDGERKQSIKRDKPITSSIVIDLEECV